MNGAPFSDMLSLYRLITVNFVQLSGTRFTHRRWHWGILQGAHIARFLLSLLWCERIYLFFDTKMGLLLWRGKQRALKRGTYVLNTYELLRLATNREDKYWSRVRARLNPLLE